MILAIAAKESGLSEDPLIEGPSTRHGKARSPLQIIKPTFDQLNASLFGNALDWDNPEDHLRASVALLKQLTDKYAGDVHKIAQEYYSGQTASTKRRPSGGTPGPSSGDYADSVVLYYYDLAAP